MRKVEITEKFIEDLKEISRKAIIKTKYNKALSAIEVCAGILYAYNQRYRDDDLEEMLLFLSESLVNKPKGFIKGNVIFYDGFGLDTRGLEINYCKAIVQGGYKLFYITLDESKNLQPHLKYELRDYDVDYIYINRQDSNINQIKDLNEIFLKARPEHSFFYTQPNDVIGTVIFDGMEGCTTRFQLDLTDHAFWLGVNTFDICLDSRDVGQSIQRYERRIPLEKIIRIKPAPYIDTLAEVNELPFDIKNFRYIFSGGQLYKTLGDPNNTFYHMVEILLEDKTLKFVYAGNGDSCEMKKLAEKFPEQVFYFSERPDFYELIKGCTLYLNTYPMFGGLMMRYAALAGKIPLTIKHGNESDGILIDQENRKIEYSDAKSLIDDAKKLLSDKDYLEKREKLLNGAVISFEVFSRNLNSLMKFGKTEYKSSFINIDTKEFRKECLNRFDLNASIKVYLLKKRHFNLILNFPFMFCIGFLRKLIKKIRRK